MGNNMRDTNRSPTSPFLRLPLELRRQIYTLLLPHTTTLAHQLPHNPAPKPYNLTLLRPQQIWKMQRPSPDPATDIVWRRGCTALLAVCHQLHDETASMLYGENTFVIDVKFDSVDFRYRWLTPQLLTPRRNFAFLEHFSYRNLLRIKRYIVNVESVDDYTGMIKYNCGGRGLPIGLRVRVQELVQVLGGVAEGLRELRVHLIDGGVSRVRFPSGRVHRVQEVAGCEGTGGVLEPFGALREVRSVRVTGVSEEYAGALEGKMRSGM